MFHLVQKKSLSETYFFGMYPNKPLSVRDVYIYVF